MPFNESLVAKPGAEVYRNYTNISENDAITSRSVFSTGSTALDTLPLSLYYELLVAIIHFSSLQLQ